MNYENTEIQWGSDSNECGWYNIEGLYSWGSNLEELLANAHATKIDQDGGEVGFVSISELPEKAEQLIKDYFSSL
jgi:hypothetical protein